MIPFIERYIINKVTKTTKHSFQYVYNKCPNYNSSFWNARENVTTFFDLFSTANRRHLMGGGVSQESIQIFLWMLVVFKTETSGSFADSASPPASSKQHPKFSRIEKL